MSNSNALSDLQSAKDTFEGVLAYDTLEVNIKVRRRMMASSFCAEDIVCVLEFKQTGEMGNLPLMACMLTIHQALLELVRRLKTEFDNGMKRLCFFSCSVDQMTSSIYSGMRDLFGELEEDLVGAIIHPLFVYLCSKTEVKLDSNLEIKCTICSLTHTTAFLKRGKRKSRPINRKALPQRRKLGYRRTPKRKSPKFPQRHYGKIIVPSGFPAKMKIFENR